MEDSLHTAEYKLNYPGFCRWGEETEMEKFYYEKNEQGLSRDEIRGALLESLEGREL